MLENENRTIEDGEYAPAGFIFNKREMENARARVGRARYQVA